MEEPYDEIESLILGELSEEKAEKLRTRIEDDEELRRTYLAFKASHAAVEYQIAEDTRDFFKDIVRNKEKVRSEKPSTKILYLTGIAASLIVLIFSIASVNISHSDSAIASNYDINSISIRDGAIMNNSIISDAIQAYYQNDYQKAKELLAAQDNTQSVEHDYRSWLELLISLKTEGSNSDSFQNRLELIENNENHEFNSQAKLLKRDLGFFWRKLVVKNW